MGDILKEAIADAKAVRETALENAKAALEEAFTPRLQSMLSAKLKEEEAEEVEMDEEEAEEDEEAEEGGNSVHKDYSEGEDKEETVDEEIVDLSELLDELEDKDEDEDVAEEVEKLQGDLTEHRKVIKYLKSKLNEVNLLNAKLLFTNKLFKTYNLNNNQKLRVVETFDRAKNSREIKLIYSTLAESFAGKTSGVKVSKINESFASKPVKSTKPKKVIAEGSDLANRFKKLAGIK